ncbi:cytidine deaminase [Aureisphaera galaxeae]|uniref:cytidine deaminase n=1 Tax=Aureisphaera galaxeae TaxID=1538023 RepID=UPI002350B0A6|nr:cytidine deaminase [Aureisphaera galaxeae]MDC8005640.1 cytidine deaminase [Aureisphaera galaxeae]
MKKLKIETELDVFESVSELSEDIQQLMDKAHEARKNAYAPYSHFQVGAAILLDSGEVVTGNNQENAAFPSGLCAERVAAFHAGATYPNAKFTAMALTAGSLKQETKVPIPPCGACRQSLAEYEVKQEAPIPIYFMGASGKVVKAQSVKDLLPLIFDHSYL